LKRYWRSSGDWRRDYNPDRIVNLGDGHASWDNGFGYTYFDTTTGLEFTAVSGLTYNFKNYIASKKAPLWAC
jgi:hypothetical protein